MTGSARVTQDQHGSTSEEEFSIDRVLLINNTYELCSSFVLWKVGLHGQNFILG